MWERVWVVFKGRDGGQDNREAGPQAERGLPVRIAYALIAEQQVIYSKECRRTPAAKACICESRVGLQNTRVCPGAHTSARNYVTDDRRMRCGYDERRAVSGSSCTGERVLVARNE